MLQATIFFSVVPRVEQTHFKPHSSLGLFENVGVVSKRMCLDKNVGLRMENVLGILVLCIEEG